MKVVITGGLGFIGKHLTEKLKKENYEVIYSDTRVVDYEDYIRADVTDYLDLQKIKKISKKIDIVIHMAGEVGRMVGEEYPQKMIYVNAVGTLNIINFCLENDCKLVYFSTSEVYGKVFEEKSVSEKDLLKIPIFELTNIYAASKYFCEFLIWHYVKNYNLKAVIIRPFMVYGPGVFPSKYKSAIDQFIYNALNNKKLIVHRNTERAWCYISDFVEGVMLVINKHNFENFDAYNIGSEEYVRMEDVAKMVLKYTDAPLDLLEIVEPPKQFLVTKKSFSIEKIKKLGFEPKVSLEEGIKLTIQWHKKILNDRNNW
ncbi:MAG: NAD(P)-dependent oxidoreductase [Candidatus Methanomethylicia archaeon]